MAQYAKVMLRTRSKEAPDFGIGQGVIASVLVRLSDDDLRAGIQMNEVWQRMVDENLMMDAESITEKEWLNADDPNRKTDQDLLIECIQDLYPEEAEEGMSYSVEEEEMRGDRIWYRERYKVPDEFGWVGQFVRGVGVWENRIFLFDTSNKFIGSAVEINEGRDYKFDSTPLKEIIGEQEYKDYFEKKR